MLKAALALLFASRSVAQFCPTAPHRFFRVFLYRQRGEGARAIADGSSHGRQRDRDHRFPDPAFFRAIDEEEYGQQPHAQQGIVNDLKVLGTQLKSEKDRQ